MPVIAEGHIEKAMSMLRGNQAKGEMVPRLFQTQLAIELVNGKHLRKPMLRPHFKLC